MEFTAKEIINACKDAVMDSIAMHGFRLKTDVVAQEISTLLLEKLNEIGKNKFIKKNSKKLKALDNKWKAEFNKLHKNKRAGVSPAQVK